MKPAIEVKGISKCYTINHKDRASYSTIKDDFAHLLSSPFEKRETSEEKFWALKDVSFSIMPGEIFGVIGKNGSGKSTLLKILSRIVEPTKGEIKMHGRVASLLEVGTGFHPELTGRENVYFNGSMLGMSKKEINKKFDEIVEFSEIEKFIDTPVKFYSSGMYVRLAFAVAAHLDPDILILDEVLAVGDAAFQQKSLRKIQETILNGKTVLFVSHSMGAVRQLCSNGIYLDGGKVEHIGKIDEIIEAYSLDATEQVTKHTKEDIGRTWKNKNNQTYDYFTPQEVYLSDNEGNKVRGALVNNTEYWLDIIGDVSKADPFLNVGYSLWDQDGRNLLYMTLCTDVEKEKWPILSPGKIHLKGRIPANIVNAGVYRIKVISGIHAKSWIIDPDASQIKIQFSIRHGKKPSPIWIEGRGGIFAPSIEWKAII